MSFCATLNRGKWFLLALAFLGVNSTAVYLYATRMRATYVRVVRFTPESGLVSGRTVLRWLFSVPMAANGAARPDPDWCPVKLIPETDGVFRWVRPNELAFRPAAPWPGCTRYRAVLSDGLQAADGRGIEGPRCFEFRSDPLRLCRAEQVDFLPLSRVTVKLVFSDPVVPAQLRAHLSVLSAAGAVLPHEVRGERSSRTQTLTIADVAGEEIVVVLRQGLQSAAGPLGLETDLRQPLKLSRDLRVQGIRPFLNGFSTPAVRLSFNLPIDVTTAGEFIHVSPHVATVVEACYGWYGESDYRLVGPFEPGRSYTVTLATGLKSTAGSALERDVTRTVYFPDAEPALEFDTAGHYMSPRGGMRIPFKMMNVRTCKATVQRIYANNLVQLAMRRGNRYSSYYGPDHQGLSRVIAERTLPGTAEPNKVEERIFDVGEILREQCGAFHIELHDEENAHAAHYLVVSDIGVSVKCARAGLLVWANALRSLEPVEGADVKVFSEENQLLLHGQTDRQGMALFEREPAEPDGEPFLVLVQKGEDLTFLTLGESRVDIKGTGTGRPYLETGYEAYIFTDRGIYRPGETAHVKAVVRGLGLSCPEPFPVELRVFRPDGRPMRTVPGLLTSRGTAECEIVWPEFAPTGLYVLRLGIPGVADALGQTGVAVEEFVPAQIRVTLETDASRLAAGEPLELGVRAEHLFGSPAAGLPVAGHIEFAAQPFTAGSWPDYQFGDGTRTFSVISKALGENVLDSDGRAAFFTRASPEWRPPAAVRASVYATVTDISGRAVTGHAARTIDVYPFYIGIRRAATALEDGKVQRFDIRTVCPDGTLHTAADRLEAAVYKLTWVSVLKKDAAQHYRYQSEEQAVPLLPAAALALDAGCASFAFTPRGAGAYRLCLRDPVSDTASSLEVYISSPDQSWNAWSMEAPDVVELSLDKDRYAAGETATLAIKAPFTGKALVSVESTRVLWHRVLELAANTARVEIPVGAEYGPNAYCCVSLIRPVRPEANWSPHRAVGAVPLTVDATARRLKVELRCVEQMRPNGVLELGVRVRDAAGAPADSELVVAAVDEGICMLTDFETPDPFAFFTARRALRVALHDLYACLMPELVDGAVGGTPASPGGGAGFNLRRRLNPVRARRFKPVALWASRTTAGGEEETRVQLRVPEFTGTLRLMAVAVAKDRFGSATRAVQVRRPLIVQSSLPRFVAPGDRFEFPVRLINEGEAGGEAVVGVACRGPLSLDGGQERVEQTVPVGRGQSTNLVFALAARPVPGRAQCRLSVTMGPEHVEEEIELPVRPPAPLVSVCGAGSVEPGRTAAVPTGAAWLAGTGRTELWLSGLPGVKLGGSLDYLLRYPYGCLEQTTSTALPLLYLAELAERLYPGWLTREDVGGRVRAGIERLLAMQRYDGSFSLWPGGDAYVWGSVYAVHFLAEARKAGYDVPADRLEAACAFLEKWLAGRAGHVRADGCRIRENLAYDRAYACLALATAGKPQHGWVARLEEQADGSDRGTLANIAAALAAGGRRREASACLDRIGAGPVGRQPREIGGSLRSTVRDDAVLLATWLELDPSHACIPLFVRRLEAAQEGGRWPTTQENAMAVMALGKYCARLAGERKPVTGALRWTGAGGSSVAGDGDIGFENEDEWHRVAEGDESTSFQIRNTGRGPVYYCWKADGVPADGRVPEIDRGLKIRRSVLDRAGRPLPSRPLVQGELVVVKLEIEAGSELDNIVVEDLLPGGLEIENASLSISETIAWVRDRQTLTPEHTDVRDDRLLAFTGALTGRHVYYYAARAVTKGDFVWPAVQASCMYDPELKSVNGAHRVRVGE
ncbi:MAG: hypothetical protein JXR37_03180 [Kiritimatiellae bacterium]|nr:hypothetical protein [Kiritimatiellia bacterium]